MNHYRTELTDLPFLTKRSLLLSGHFSLDPTVIVKYKFDFLLIISCVKHCFNIPYLVVEDYLSHLVSPESFLVTVVLSELSALSTNQNKIRKYYIFISEG